jgi:S-adenosylmethionine hydrolase
VLKFNGEFTVYEDVNYNLLTKLIGKHQETKYLFFEKLVFDGVTPDIIEIDELGNVIKETEPEESLMLVLPYADLQEFLTKKVKMVLDYKLENEKQKNIFLKSTDWLDLKVMFHIDATMVINPETIN